MPQPPDISAILVSRQSLCSRGGIIHTHGGVAGQDLPVDAPKQDGTVRTGDGVDKHPELAVRPERLGLGIGLVGADPLPDPDVVVGRHDAEEDQDDHLERDAGDDGLVAVVDELEVGVVAGGAGAGREGAADGLDEQAGHVGRHEDEREQVRADAGERRVQRQADVLEGEVDGDADQRRRQDDGTDLRLEGTLVPRVRMERDARSIASRDVSVLVR